MRLQALEPGFRLIAFALGLFALGLIYLVIAPSYGVHGLLAWTVNFFSFFTVISNTLAVAAMLAPGAAPRSTLGRFFDRPAVRSTIAGYLIIVAGIYFFFLRNAWNPTGLQMFADSILHYVMPLLFLIDWALFVPKGRASWRRAAASLALPVVYIAWTFAHGGLTGWYPYPFVDVTKLGYTVVGRNMVLLFAAFVAAAAALAAIDRLAARPR